MTDDTKTNFSLALKDLREARGLGLSDVAKQLNLAEEQLEKFEEPELDPSSLDPFQRGYLRNYVMFLEMDTKRLEEFLPEDANGFSELKSTQKFNLYQEKKRMISASGLKWIFVVLLVVVLGYGLSSALKSESKTLSEFSNDTILMQPSQDAGSHSQQ